MPSQRQMSPSSFSVFLGVPFFSFHDRDIAPEGKTLRESNSNVRAIADVFAQKMQETKIRLLWGTANLFSNRRFMGGAATNPDPNVFAYAAAQVKNALEITHELGGENYVLWGGREGYETLLNTNLKRELDQLGRFLNLVVEHKHKIGFKGTILIEPKPKEPTKHQYDFDVATVYGMLKTYGLEKEVKTNIEQNHAILAGHNFEHAVPCCMDAAIGAHGERGADGLLHLLHAEGDGDDLGGLAGLLEADRLLDADLVEGIHRHLDIGRLDAGAVRLDADFHVVVDDALDRDQNLHVPNLMRKKDAFLEGSLECLLRPLFFAGAQ